MESNNNNCNNGQEENQQPQKANARKRKFYEANDGQMAEDQQEKMAMEKQQTETNEDDKNEENEGGGSHELELESLSRVELIKLVNETKTQLMGMRQELEEKSTQIESLHNEVDKLRVFRNVRAKRAKRTLRPKRSRFCRLCKKTMTGARNKQIVMPRPMKIDLPLETWFDLLAFLLTFLSRLQLGKIVPYVGNRQFAKIVQSFLHKHGIFTLGKIVIFPPHEDDASVCARTSVWHEQMQRSMRIKLPNVEMPTNIRDFSCIELSYFDMTVVNFFEHFKQNGLMQNVNLSICGAEEIWKAVFYHLLPLIDSFNSIQMWDVASLVRMYNCKERDEFSEMVVMKMFTGTRILKTDYEDYNHELYNWCRDHGKEEKLPPNQNDMLCQWLYQPETAGSGDGLQRILFLHHIYFEPKPSPISIFIDRIKQDFLMATHPVFFCVRINLWLKPKGEDKSKWQEGIPFDLENGKTNERLVIKVYEENDDDEQQKDEYSDRRNGDVTLLISRYPMDQDKQWMEECEESILSWEFGGPKMIEMGRELEENKYLFRNLL